MKTVGIIGGIAPESTIDYYRKIISAYLSNTTAGNYPQIIINSINMTKMLELIANVDLDGVSNYLSAEISKLEDAGADFAIMASNTPHIVFDRVQKLSVLPLVSIVDATCHAISNSGLQHVGLLGTKFTMQGGFYNTALAAHGIEVITPDEEDQVYIHDKYMGEFVKGVFLEGTRLVMLNIINKMKASDGIEGLILGGTELPLILKKDDFFDFELFDTTEIHAEKVVQLLI